MKWRYSLAIWAAGVLVSGPAIAEAQKQPPMNQFNEAFYKCENGGAFMMSYDSARPETATMTTSNDNRKYALKRSPVDGGVQFSAGAVTFWTDGKKVVVQGTQATFQGCKTNVG